MKSDLQQDVILDPETLQSHVAIIMDGNGRWAKKKLMNRIKGHEHGSDTVRSIVTAARELGIKVLTLYAFSTENWARPKHEVKALMMLVKRFIISQRSELSRNNIRLNIIGQKHRLPIDVQKEIAKSISKICEDFKVAIRNIRRDSNEMLKDLQKDGDISEDDSFNAQKQVQEATDTYIKKLDKIFVDKEKEILEV